MRRKLNSAPAMFGLLLLGSMGLAGCADSNYDLGNLNKTIAIGSEEGFALPGNNSTSDMILDDLLDLEDNDAIQVAEDGSYVFSRGADEEDVDGASPVVDEIPRTQVASENDFDYNLGEMLGEEARGPRKVSEDSPTAREIFSFEFQKSDLSAIEDVLGIALATLRAGINVDLNFSDDLKAQIGNLRGLTLDLPDFFDLEVDPNGNNITFNNQTNELKVDNLKELKERLNVASKIIISKASPCNACKYLNICNGGCPGLSTKVFGSPNMGDIRCPIVAKYAVENHVINSLHD